MCRFRRSAFGSHSTFSVGFTFPFRQELRSEACMLPALVFSVACGSPIDKGSRDRVNDARSAAVCFGAFYLNQGKHILEEWADLGEEMSHVEGAVVVRRPDLIDVGSSPSLLAPAGDLDFVKTLQSYFPIFQSSLFPRYDTLKGAGVNGGVIRGA